jgi:adenosylcobinamide-GDP ribazoletransferase
MSSFFQALAFFTRFPVPARFQQGDFSRSIKWFPVVGCLLGLVLALFDWIFAFIFPDLVRAVLIVVVWVYLTGALHLDGLMDTADGLGSYRSRERVLEIMRDSRVGAMGVVTAILALLLKISSLATISVGWTSMFALIGATVMGRFLAVQVIWLFPYVRAEGIGVGMKKHLKAVHVWLALVFTLVVLCLLFRWKGLLLFMVASGFILFFAWRVKQRLGGLTGDVYGAVIELGEVVVLLTVLAGEV